MDFWEIVAETLAVFNSVHHKDFEIFESLNKLRATV